MTRPSPAQLHAALDPVRRTLLDRARADADAELAHADADAAAALAQARAEAAAILARATADGERDAGQASARERASTQREARSTVLRARSAAHAELRARSRAAAVALREDPGYPTMLQALRARATAALGPGATVLEARDGGVVAEAPGRRIDASLPALADRALDRLGPEVTRLWAP